MAVKMNRVAVIGAGPAGAIATDALAKEQAFDTIRVFERKEKAGGTWVLGPNVVPRIPSLGALLEQRADLPIPIPSSFPSETKKSDSNSHQFRYSDTGVHENLHSNLPPSTMSFTQEPIPNILSQRTLDQYGPKAPFRHRAVVRDWVEDIFTRGGYQDLVEYDTAVEHAVKKGQEWVLTLRKTTPGKTTDYWWQETFDSLVVASGHYSLPHIPNIPGLVEYDQKFPGTIRHSKHFRSANEFKGKTVIVVGGSISAIDAVHEIRTVAKRPIIASLREPLPVFGWGPFTHPHINIRSPIARFYPDSGRIEFVDGSWVDHVDIVLFATGYDFSFPFLPDAVIEHRRIIGLYQHVFNIDDPSLAFIGMVAGGLTFRVFEWQAVAVARLFAGRTTLPSRKEMETWERERILTRGEGIPFFTLAPDFEEYFEGLRILAGEPALGTTGRSLPPFESWWVDEFLVVVNMRSGWWDKERKIAQEELNSLVGKGYEKVEV